MILLLNNNYNLNNFISSIIGYNELGNISKHYSNDITHFKFWITTNKKISFENFEIINERNTECIPVVIEQRITIDENYFETQNQFQNNICYLVILKSDFEKCSGIVHDVFGTIATSNKINSMIDSQSLIIINLFIVEDYFTIEKYISDVLKYGNDTTGLPPVKLISFEEDRIVNKLLYINAEKEVINKTQIKEMAIYSKESFILSLKSFCRDKDIGTKSLIINKKSFFEQKQINSFSVQAINILLRFTDDIENLNQLFKTSKLRVSDKNLIREKIFISCYNMLFEILSTKNTYMIPSSVSKCFKKLLVDSSIMLSKTLDMEFANSFNISTMNNIENDIKVLNFKSFFQTINTNSYKSKYNNLFYNPNTKLQFLYYIEGNSSPKEISTLIPFSKVCFKYSRDLEETLVKDLFDFSPDELLKFFVILQNALPNNAQFSIIKTILKKYYQYFDKVYTPTYECLCNVTEYRIMNLKNKSEYEETDTNSIKETFKNSYDFFTAISYLHKNAVSFKQHQFIFYTLVGLYTRSIINGYLLPIDSFQNLLYEQATIQVTIKENSFEVNALEDYKKLISDCVVAYQKANFKNENAIKSEKEINILDSPNFNNTTSKQKKEEILRKDRVLIGSPLIKQLNESEILPYMVSLDVISLYRRINPYMIKIKFDKILELIKHNNITDKKEIIEIIKSAKNISASKTPYTLFRAYILNQLTSFGETSILDENNEIQN